MSKDIEVEEIFDLPHTRMIEIRLGNGAILQRHRASEPITVLCVAGKGIFNAGDDLAEQMPLSPGTLLTLRTDVVHEVRAEPYIHLVLTKFKNT